MSETIAARRPVYIIVSLTIFVICLELFVIYGSGGVVAQGLGVLISRLAFLAVPLSLIAVLIGRVSSNDRLLWRGLWGLIGAFNLLFVQVMLMGHLARWKAEGEIQRYVSEVVAPAMRSYRIANGTYPSSLSEVVYEGDEEVRFKPALHFSRNEYLLVFFLPGSAMYIYRGSDATWRLTQPWSMSNLCPGCVQGAPDSEYAEMPAQ